jgi:hypothetical protein
MDKKTYNSINNRPRITKIPKKTRKKTYITFSFFFSLRPFPMKTPVTIVCQPGDFIRINGSNLDNTQTICLKLIVVNRLGEDGSPDLHYYGLTTIDNVEITPINSSIPTDTPTWGLAVNINDRLYHYEYRYIPTFWDNDHQAFLSKFCSPLCNVKWSPIKCFTNVNILALELLISATIDDIQTSHTNPPSVSFEFPILDTLENRMELEELADNRHHCTYLPCSDFLVCPTSFFEPDNSVPAHKHCTNKKCVRFFEQNEI